ncbi:hypothetical protein KNSL1_013770 [Colletotrichum chrysophilum]|nr:hypothetical protein KNSL1_013770 [Colletotrichum chrysophilum]
MVIAISLLGAFAGLLEDHGYSVDHTNGLYFVKSSHYVGGNAPLNKVKINTDRKTMTVYLAYNGAEANHRKKLKLSQVLTALCEKHSLNPEDLARVVIDDVENMDTKAAMKKYRDKHNLRFKDEIRITPDKQSDWAIFSSTPFYKAVDRMVPRKGITQIIVKKEDGNQNMYLSIG